MTKSKAYVLYTDNTLKEMITMAYTKDDMKEETQYHTSGVWVEYDLENEKFLVNEKILKTRFPKKSKERPKKEFTHTKNESGWIK
jgi:hypothetical protein